MGCHTCSSLTRARRDELIKQALSIGRTVASWSCPTCGNVLTIEPDKVKAPRKAKKARKKRKPGRSRSRR